MLACFWLVIRDGRLLVSCCCFSFGNSICFINILLIGLWLVTLASVSICVFLGLVFVSVLATFQRFLVPVVDLELFAEQK